MGARLQMTPDEIVRSLRDMGVPSEKAKAVAGVEAPAANYMQVVGPMLRFPIRVVLPWSALVSDNTKWAAAMRGKRAALLLTPKYRAAKSKAKALAEEAMTVDGTTFPPIGSPLSMTARVYVPDKRPHDVCNFAKCAQDAFSKVIYADDVQLHEIRWIRAGVDVDHPRAEVELTPL